MTDLFATMQSLYLFFFHLEVSGNLDSSSRVEEAGQESGGVTPGLTVGHVMGTMRMVSEAGGSHSSSFFLYSGIYVFFSRMIFLSRKLPFLESHYIFLISIAHDFVVL